MASVRAPTSLTPQRVAAPARQSSRPSFRNSRLSWRSSAPLRAQAFPLHRQPSHHICLRQHSSLSYGLAKGETCVQQEGERVSGKFAAAMSIVRPLTLSWQFKCWTYFFPPCRRHRAGHGSKLTWRRNCAQFSESTPVRRNMLPSFVGLNYLR